MSCVNACCKNIRRTARVLRVLLLVVIAALAMTAEPCQANRLRDLKVGDALPGFELESLGGGGKKSFQPGNGKPSAVLFFSDNPEFRKKRSLPLLAALEGLQEQFKQKVSILAVYSDEEQSGRATLDFIREKSLKIPVLDDSRRNVYNKYGIFMMPLVILIDSQGRLQEVIPYTYNIREMVEGNLKVMLGEWKAEQLQEFLQPKETAVHSPEEKEYIRRINYGRVMSERKMFSQAIREFSTAIKLLPNLVEGHVELGFAHLSVQDWAQAEASFRAALKMDAESDGAVAGLGLALYGRGNIDAALPELENAFIAPNPKLEVIVALADIYEKKGNVQKAIRLNKLAVSRLMTMYEHRWK